VGLGLLPEAVVDMHFTQRQRLPGERELGQQYGVALGTVRRALDVLRERGLVVTLLAKGTFITERR
jgi:DNA-binding GntR family transcriptional regulator